jgi:hypothetical protein
MTLSENNFKLKFNRPYFIDKQIKKKCSTSLKIYLNTSKMNITIILKIGSHIQFPSRTAKLHPINQKILARVQQAHQTPRI